MFVNDFLLHAMPMLANWFRAPGALLHTIAYNESLNIAILSMERLQISARTLMDKGFREFDSKWMETRG